MKNLRKKIADKAPRTGTVSASVPSSAASLARQPDPAVPAAASTSAKSALPRTNPLEPVPREYGVRSPLEQYLREISEVPLQTPD